MGHWRYWSSALNTWCLSNSTLLHHRLASVVVSDPQNHLVGGNWLPFGLFSQKYWVSVLIPIDSYFSEGWLKTTNQNMFSLFLAPGCRDRWRHGQFGSSSTRVSGRPRMLSSTNSSGALEHQFFLFTYLGFLIIVTIVTIVTDSYFWTTCHYSDWLIFFVWWLKVEKPLLNRSLGIMIIQERGIPRKQPVFHGMIEGFWTLLNWWYSQKHWVIPW